MCNVQCGSKHDPTREEPTERGCSRFNELITIHLIITEDENGLTGALSEKAPSSYIISEESDHLRIILSG